MKKILLILFISCVVNTYSQEAKALLNKVAETTQAYDNIYIEFSHKLDNQAANLHQETEGNVTMQGDLYRFNYMGLERLFDGNLIYDIIHEDQEIAISKPKTNNDEIITPSNILSFYEDGFTYEMDIVQNVNGRNIQFVKLTPMNSDVELKYVHVGVDKKTNHLYKVIQTGLDDTVTTITVTKLLTNQTVSEQIFTFDRAKFEKEGYYITETK